MEIWLKLPESAVQFELNNVGGIGKRDELVALLVVKQNCPFTLDVNDLQKVRIPKLSNGAISDANPGFMLCNGKKKRFQVRL